MKKSLIGIISIASLVFVGCGEQETTKEDNNEVTVAATKLAAQINGDAMVTTNEIEQANESEVLLEKNLKATLNADNFCYVGQFEALNFDQESGGMRSNKITIQFDTVMNDTLIFGYSIVAGNLRPFSGDVFIGNDYWEINVKEPGDDKYDGQFIMNLTQSILSGKWYANDSKLKVSGRKFKLESKLFKYDSSLMVNARWIPLYEHGKTKKGNILDEDGEEYYVDEVVETLTDASSEINASSRELTKEDLENLYKTDLEIIRNTIYARHGYSFKNRKIRNVFDQYVDWYIPFSIDVSGELTDLEVKNITLIKRYEKHADTYYDNFGR